MGPVSVTAPGSDSASSDISWLASYQGTDSVVVLLVNHGDNGKSVDVTWRGPCAGGRVEVGDSTLSTSAKRNSTVFTMTVPPQDLVLLRVSKSCIRL